MNKECRAKDPAACRIHGTPVIAKQVHRYAVEQGYTNFSPEEAEIFTEDVINIIQQSQTEESTIQSSRDEAGIWNEWKTQHFNDYYSMHAPAKELIGEIAFLYDPDKTVIPENNVLDPKKASLYGGYHTSVGRMLAKEGLPVSPHASYLSWEDYEMQPHLRECGFASISTSQPTMWHEFNGTYNDDDDSLEGVEADAQCNCGRFKNKLRMAADTATLTRTLLSKYTS